MIKTKLKEGERQALSPELCATLTFGELCDHIMEQFEQDDEVGSLLVCHYTMQESEGEGTHKISVRETKNMKGQGTIRPEDGMVRALTLDFIDLFVKIPAGEQ